MYHSLEQPNQPCSHGGEHPNPEMGAPFHAQPPFTTGMFRSTNPKGTVFVLHFLLTTLKPDNSVRLPPSRLYPLYPLRSALLLWSWRVAQPSCRHSLACGLSTTLGSPATSVG